MSDDSNGLNETLKCLIKPHLARLRNCLRNVTNIMSRYTATFWKSILLLKKATAL